MNLKVYFATESPRLIEMARAFFAPFQNALYVSDKMVQPQQEAANMTNLDNEPDVDEQVCPSLSLLPTRSQHTFSHSTTRF